MLWGTLPGNRGGAEADPSPVRVPQQAGQGLVCVCRGGGSSKEVLVGRLCVLSELGFSTPRAATVLE